MCVFVFLVEVLVIMGTSDFDLTNVDADAYDGYYVFAITTQTWQNIETIGVNYICVHDFIKVMLTF